MECVPGAGQDHAAVLTLCWAWWSSNCAGAQVARGVQPASEVDLVKEARKIRGDILDVWQSIEVEGLDLSASS